MAMKEPYHALGKEVTLSGYDRLTEQDSADEVDTVLVLGRAQAHHARPHNVHAHHTHAHHAHAHTAHAGVGSWINSAAMATAALSAVFFLVSLVLEYRARQSEILDVSWNLMNSPQTLIAFSLIFGAAFMWLLRNALGRVLGLAFFGHALYRWFEATGGLGAISGNSIPGAVVFEFLALAATLSLSAFIAYYLVRGLLNHFARGAENNQEQGLLQPRPR